MKNPKIIKVGSEVFISAQDLKEMLKEHELQVIKGREKSLITDTYHLATLHALDVIDLIVFTVEGLEY
jgi:hypothetical protein